MFLAIIIGIAILLVIFAAARIILGWVLPAQIMAKVDAVVSASLRLITQVSVVIAAAFILYVGYLAAKG